MRVSSVEKGSALARPGRLAGVGTGVWPSVEDACRATIRLEDTCEPNAELRAMYDRLYAVYQRLYAQLADLYDQTADIGS